MKVTVLCCWLKAIKSQFLAPKKSGTKLIYVGCLTDLFHQPKHNKEKSGPDSH